MNNTMEELLKASSAKLHLVEIYEENMWAILSRLLKRAIDANKASLLNTTLPQDFKVKDVNFHRKISNTTSKSRLSSEKSNYERKLTSRYKYKQPAKRKASLSDLCFTGKYGEELVAPSYIKSNLGNSSPSKNSVDQDEAKEEEKYRNNQRSFTRLSTLKPSGEGLKK